MKFAFVLFHYFPFGGLQQDLLKIIRACRRKNISITVFAMSWRGERPEGVEVRIVPVSGNKNAQREAFVDAVNSATASGFDLVLGFNKMPGLDFYYAADICFAEKAYNERSWLYRLTPRCKQYLAFEESVFGRDSSTISLLLSPSQREEFGRHYATPSKRLIDLPPGIREDCKAGDDASVLREDLRREYGLGDDELLVLQIGSAFKTKGVSRSLRALASLPEALRQRTHYCLIGEDDPAPFHRQAARLGIERFQVRHGQNDIPRFLQGADLLLHPSVRESAGMVIVEAIIAGLPVLTTAACGYAFHVEAAKAGMVCPEPFRQADLNRMLAEMLTSPAKAEWRACGVRYGREHDLYHMPDFVADLLYEAVLTQSLAAP